ncbi:hypothetical protein VB796_08665 [Arcicella sp. LKC2W]|uniref:hypothetical protein n=1 Tax=Arcicella sp. LKC2W TaxID=2984198 RepID=UPI002B2122AF|nr:hypothetical protein [Arcicella sp. LKC2W]MEA5459106.1 hypothetical protein [Arcicella sp. LKC2W]
MKIHTTIGVYANGDIKINGVTEEYLESHLEYNRGARPGRSLFLDGKCVQKGYLSDKTIEEFEAKIANNKDFVKTYDTQPYV